MWLPSTRITNRLARIGTACPYGGDVLVLAHGGVIIVYTCDLLGRAFNSLWHLRADKTSLTHGSEAAELGDGEQ